MQNLTQEDRKKIRNKAKSEIERLEHIFADIETTQLLDSFRNKFNMCESAYKIILFEHQKAKGNPTELKNLRLDMRQVQAALNFAGYNFSSTLLNELFGSKSKIKGYKTVKNLRNSITHGISEKCVDEIKKRKEELFGYMNTFLNVIKEFDNDAKIK